MIGIDDDDLAAVLLRGAPDPARARRKHVLTEACRMDERLRQRLHFERGERQYTVEVPGRSSFSRPRIVARAGRSVPTRVVPLKVRTVSPSDSQRT